MQPVAIWITARVEQGSVRDIFSNPHSDAAKRLVFPAGTPERELLPGRKMVRVAFNGTQTTDKRWWPALPLSAGRWFRLWQRTPAW